MVPIFPRPFRPICGGFQLEGVFLEISFFMWQHKIKDKHKLMSHQHQVESPLGSVKHRCNVLHFTEWLFMFVS